MSDKLKTMSRKEKIGLCTGADLWHSRAYPKRGIRRLTVSDGPHGVRFQPSGESMAGVHQAEPATCFPTATTLGCSWNPELVRQVGNAIGEEARYFGVDVVLAPGVNIQRSPLCGRHFEYFSEDPLLSGKMGAAGVRGIQEAGAGACVKHFACNSQEYKRFSSDSRVDERTLREIYLPAFETVVKEAQPAMLMCAYNQINGVYCSSNRWLLTDVLRREWGFSGVVVTDWGAMRDQRDGFAAGCDWSMPGAARQKKRAWDDAIASGRVTDVDIDASASRMLALIERSQAPAGVAFDEDAHHALARRAAAESAVLLKNEGGLLPFTQKTRLALIGYMARAMRAQGGGSSHVTPLRETALVEMFPDATYAEGCNAAGHVSEKRLQEAVQAAASAEVAVVVVGLTNLVESEGFDRDDLALPVGQDRLVEAVAEANPHTVVLLVGGAPMAMPWLSRVEAVLYLGLPGQSGAEAAADLLLGRVSPSGRLAATWPLRVEDRPGYEAPHRDVIYRESVLVGYRGYEAQNTPVAFPFGYGLTYTDFSYEDLKIDGHAVSFTLRNTGSAVGEETVQLYIEPPATGQIRPPKELRAFRKVKLNPGESRRIQIDLQDRDFAMWQDGWFVPGGVYTVAVGASVRDIRCRGTIEMSEKRLPGDHFPMPKPLPAKPEYTPKGSYTLENSLLEMSEGSSFIRLICRVMTWGIKLLNKSEDEHDPASRMVYASTVDSALFALANASCGRVTLRMVESLLLFANGKRLRALGCLCFGVRKNRKDGSDV